MLKTVNFFGNEITRLLLGDNPAHGNSYIVDLISRDEMLDYYTHDNIVKMLVSAQEAGYNAMVALASPVMLAALRQFRADGGKLKIIFQTWPPLIDEFEKNIEQMAEFDPIAIYHQGSTGENLLERGDVETYLKNFETIRKTGLPAGMAFHVPENVLRAEQENWGADFYVIGLYNTRRGNFGKQSSFITGETKAKLIFSPDDRAPMMDIIKNIPKPVVAIKTLAGGQIFIGKTKEEYPAAVERHLTEVYAGIKPSDTVCIGVFQRDTDHIRQNADIVERILC